MYEYSQGATSDHFFWVPILVTHAALPAMGAVIAVSPNGRSAGIVSDPVLSAILLIDRTQERQMDLVEVLSFLFMLSTMELGRVRILFPRFSDSSN
jgi:hypothetical protein